ICVIFRRFAHVVEAGISPSRSYCPFRIYLVEVRKHGFHRRAETVKIESVESGFQIVGTDSVVVTSEPADEVEYNGIAPHPGRKEPESFERFEASGIVSLSTDVPVDTIGVGPVGLDRYGRKSFFLDETLCYFRSFPVKFVRAV